MSKMTFNEWYGDVSVAQLAAYRRFNVSQSDHDMLVATFGDNPDVITRELKASNGDVWGLTRNTY